MDHAARIIEALVIDGQSRMLGLAEHAQQLADGDRVLDRDDVGAGDHDILHRLLAETEDVEEHGALLRADGMGFTLRAGERVLDQLAQFELLAEAEAREQALEPGRLLFGRPFDRRPAARLPAWGRCSWWRLREPRARRIRVRVGDAEGGEDCALERFHSFAPPRHRHAHSRAGAARRARRDATTWSASAMPSACRLLRHRLISEHHVAERMRLVQRFAHPRAGREGQHVGGSILSAPRAIERPHAPHRR